MNTYRFSGHDTFHCRQFWLKKAVDFVGDGKSFNSDDAALYLGVGKNMVNAIRYWARSFDIINEDDRITSFGKLLLATDKKEGLDPYLEDVGSLWLLHYKVTSKEIASIYSLLFNEISKQRPEFTTEYVISTIDSMENGHSPNTLKKDFSAVCRTYYADFQSKDIEESFTGILTELNLLRKVSKPYVDTDGKLKSREVWAVERKERPSLPAEILLYMILDMYPQSKSIDFETLYHSHNGIGNICALSKEGLTMKLEELEQKNYGLTFSNHAGVRELQMSKPLKATEILKAYYNNG